MLRGVGECPIAILPFPVVNFERETVPHEPLSGVVITSREIYDAVVRLTGRVDVLIQQTGDMQHDIQDHENRLRNLERSRWPIPALTVVISVLALVWAIYSGAH